MRRLVIVALGIGILGIGSSARTEPSFTGLGDLPGSVASSMAYGVSANGSVVVGWGTSDLGGEAFRWENGVMTGLGDSPGGDFSSTATDVSANGSIVVGRGTGPQWPFAAYEALRWQDGTMTNLGTLELSTDPTLTDIALAFGISGDGSVIVGRNESYHTSPLTQNDAVRWENGMMTSLGFLPGGNYPSAAYSASADGSVIVGQSYSVLGHQAFRWEDGVMIGLGDLPGGSFLSEAQAVSADGLVVVGRSRSSPSPGQNEAFRWESGTMIGLGHLPGGGHSSWARGVSGDGSVVVGKSDTAAGPAESEAFIWDATNQMRRLQDVLTRHWGIDLSDWTLLFEANDVSPDGRHIVGWGKRPPYDLPEAWLAFIPDPYLVAVDDFEEGPFSLETLFPGPDGAASNIQSDLPGHDVLGGTRTVRIEARGAEIPVTATLALTDGEDSVIVTTPAGGGILDLDYATLAPTDLTNGGREDRFVIDLSEATAAGSLSLLVVDESGWTSSAAFPPVSGPGRIEVPFASLGGGADLTRVTALTLSFDTLEGGQWGISIFRTGQSPFCQDGLDNDGDALVDWPDDPGCTDATDDTEIDPPLVCDDGLDNDGDGRVDFPDDPGCSDPSDLDETTELLPCDDGIDNDGDGLIDWPDDPGCFQLIVAEEDPACDDDLDNDGDGRIDWDGGPGGGDPDPQCVDKPWLDREGQGRRMCGGGAELALLLPPLMWLSRRRRLH